MTSRAKIFLGFVVLVAAIGLVSLLLQQGTETGKNVVPKPSGKTAKTTVSQGLFEQFMPGVNAQEYQYVYQQDKETLTVQGAAVFAAEPEKVGVWLGVETESTTAIESQQKNAQAMSEVTSALQSIGIAKKDIQTESYSIYPVYEYVPQSGKSFLSGYKTTHTIKVSSNDTKKAGQIIDSASAAGANIVQSVSFGLTEQTEQQLNQKALTEAAKNAKTKADSIATGLGVRIIKVVHASEASSAVPVYQKADYRLAEAAAPASTEIISGQIKVSAQVSVVFQIE